MRDFDKDILFNNIAYLLKLQNKRVGELENSAGVSTGYISRAKDGSSKPGIDFVMGAAEFLGVSMDTLVKADISALTSTEQYILSFLRKLIDDTNADKLNWKIETADYLNNLSCNEEDDMSHPLITMENVPTDRSPIGYVWHSVFVSHSFGTDTYVHGNCFHLELKSNVTLYLMDIEKGNDSGELCAKEVWITNHRNKQYLCSNNDGALIASAVDELFMFVTENSKHPKIEKEFKSVIDMFMSDQLESDDAGSLDGFMNIPDDPDELPFN